MTIIKKLQRQPSDMIKLSKKKNLYSTG